MSVGISELAPVIFAGTAGGAGEYHASNGGAPEEHIIDGGVPGGKQIIEAWYAPYDNIGDIANFSSIDVRKYDNQRVKLAIAAYPGRNARMRIRITILYAD